MRGDTPIASPTIPPTPSARRSPISSLVRLMPKFRSTEPSFAISIISSNTPAGIGMIRDGSSGTITCQATRKRIGAVIRAARGVVMTRRKRDGVPRGAAVPGGRLHQRTPLT